MNKRFSTLMTAGLLMVGALFSNANAAIETTALTVVDGDGFKDGKSYYVVMTGSDATLADGSIVLGMKNTDGTLSATNVVMTGADAASKEHIWKVTKAIVEGKVEYTLYNAEAGAYLAFATAKIEAKEGTNAEIAIGTIVTSKKLADGKAADVDFTFALPSNEAYSGGGQLFASSADAGTDETFLKLAANATTLEATGNYKIVLCELAEKELDADALNAPLAGKGFSFDFPLADGEPALEGNVFAQPLKAFTFANTTAAPVTGTYFAVSYPADGKIETANEFAGSTFIALDPINNYGFTGVDAKEGLGYKFKTVAGKVLKASPDIKKGDIPAENAMFTVTEEHPSNAAGQFSISMSDVKVKDGDDFSATKDVFVAVVKSMNKNYLTTNKEASAAKFATSDMVTAKDLLKASAPAVYQIMFTSNKATVEDATSSEYGKYLHVTSDGSDFSLQADGSSFVMLNTPNAQWTIAAVDADNMFTFRNRETDEEVSMVLYKTGEGDYLVKDAKDAPAFEYGYLTTGGAYTVTTGSSDNLKGTTIKLVEVKNITPTAGFVNLTNEQLEGLTKIQFTKPDDITADNLFVTVASNKDVKVNKDEAEAALWEVVKFDASAADKSMAISDTIYNVNGFVYWDATKKEVKEKAEGDTVAVISYAFKLFTNDAKNWYLNAAGAKAVEVKEAEEPAKFVLKLNNNGSYSLIKADADFTTMVAAAATVFSVDGATKALVNTEELYTSTAVRDFSFVKDATTPSLKHVTQLTILQAITGGYIAIGEKNDAVVAPASALKAEYTAEDLTFLLDTADTKAYTPSFYISKAIKAETKAEAARMFMYNAVDSALSYNEGAASAVKDYNYMLSDKSTVKAIFRPAALTAVDTMTTIVNGKDTTIAVVASKDGKVLAGVNNFKFQIVQKDAETEGEYVIKSVGDANYLININGKLGFTETKDNALIVTVEEGKSPVGNEDIETTEVSVIAGNGQATIKNAEGKTVAISNILGQALVNTVITSDNATISVPAGIVVVAIEGENAVKAIIK